MKVVWSDPFAKALDRLAAKDKTEADQVRRSLTEFLETTLMESAREQVAGAASLSVSFLKSEVVSVAGRFAKWL